jgi:hypothetical protein
LKFWSLSLDFLHNGLKNKLLAEPDIADIKSYTPAAVLLALYQEDEQWFFH